MARYIDETLVNAKLKEICENTATTYGIVYGGRAEKFERLTEDIPTADVVEVKHGYWFIIEYDSFHCSVCGKDVPSGADSTKQAKEYLKKGLIYPYCPRCGAKMDGRRDT